MLDDALTDAFPGNDASSDDFQARLHLAVILLELVGESHAIQEIFICRWYMRFAREAIEKGLEVVPGQMTPNSVSRRALALFKMSRQRAVMTAAAERAAELRALSDAPPGSDVTRPATPEARRLTIINSLLPGLEWFLGWIDDHEPSDEIRSWLAIREELAPGAEVARLRIERMLVVARANRLRDLRALAAGGASAVDMANWLRDQLGAEFSPGSLSEYFEEAFGVDRAILRNVEPWNGFGAGGMLSDEEFSEILNPLIMIAG